MTTNCVYCNEEEDKQLQPGLVCESCFCFVHLKCLRNAGTPGDFVCDVFFDFTCEDCSSDKLEVFVRNKFPWVNVIYLTLNHLNCHSYGISNRGYFHYKTHICSFIDRNWQALFGSNSKQKKNWIGTIAGVLSIYNKLVFKSGSADLGEMGWWKLQHNFSPAVAAHIIQEVARDKPLGMSRNQLTLDNTFFISRITNMGYKDYIIEEKDSEMSAPAPNKKRRLEPPEPSVSDFQERDSNSRLDNLEECVYEDSYNMDATEGSYPELEFKEFDFTPTSQIPNMQSDTSSVTSFQHTLFFYDSDSRSGSEQEKKLETKPKKTEEKPVRRESLFSTELNSEDLPWTTPRAETNVLEMTQYEEVQLLKQIEGLVTKVKDSARRASLHRLKAKLTLRRLKRHKHLPIFNFDKTVKLLSGHAAEDPRQVNNVERVLDRFQRSFLMDNLCGTIASTTHGTLLLSRMEALPFRSPYSGVTLKPYIRRDTETCTTWMKLMDELLRKTHRHIKDYEPPAHMSIDYSYVRPQHIAAVNNLCAQFFWPGIDLTEALQYPEFSCVVTYGRLVVGCAFLVPDAGHSTAYISFVLTRPEWGRAGIATFMLYHLLQTCTGQDITLHVSPTNPAIFLYQKFGFKVEELIQDFYEKYYDIEYKGCRHALFLRLVR
ncbi:cysteine-rich protein 2-binding protein [Bombyx mandarina]|uniref:Cysteine-rich protein 2-binding protein n=1 Tax=Bombyx mandarina TaxID=7092 RepID=A0A6J2JWG0_BOMMA|nr:cysteine-rich protein 2-binding protein [Bombyx mandarina]